MLTKLFEEISHSEKSFKEKAVRLKYFSEEIESARVQLKRVNDERVMLQGELVAKANLLSEVNEDLCSSKIHLSLLKKQKEDLLSEKRDYLQQLRLLDKDMECKRQGFIGSISDFTERFGGIVTRGDVQGSELEQEMSSLEERIAVVKAELEETRQNEEDLTFLTSKVDEMRLSVEAAQNCLSDVIEQYKELTTELHQLKEEHSQLTAHDDPNIRHLQSELEHYRQQTPEDLCKELKKELEAVQRDYYNRRWKKGGPSESSPLHGQLQNVPSTREPMAQQYSNGGGVPMDTGLEWEDIDGNIADLPLDECLQSSSMACTTSPPTNTPSTDDSKQWSLSAHTSVYA